MKRKLFLSLAVAFLFSIFVVPNVFASDVTDESSLKTCLSGNDAVCKLTKPIQASNYILVNRAVTIDLNGNTISFDDKNFGVLVYSNVTLKNGTIISTGTKSDYSAITVGNNGKATLEKMNVQGNNGYAIDLFKDGNNTVTVDKDSVITGNGKNAVIYSFGESNHNTINVYGKVEITNSNGKEFAAINTSYKDNNITDINVYNGANINGGILQMASGNLTIYGGNITGPTGITMTKGNLVVKGGSISGTGDYKEFSPTSDFKVNSDGSAIYIEPTVEMNVEIDGGSFTSKNSSAISAPSNNNTNLDISIINGIFKGNEKFGDVIVNDKESFIYGGTFGNNNLNEEYLVDGLVQNENGTVVDPTKVTVTPENNPKNPNTSDTIIYSVIAIAISALGLTFVLRKLHNN